MVEQSTGGEDDWAKQMLAEALLGRSTLPTVEPALSEEAAPLDEVSLREVGASTPEVLYQVVLDEPVVTEPEIQADVAGAPPIKRPPIRYRVELEEPPVAEHVLGDPSADAPDGAPAAAVASRLFERPTFDATNDPGVEELLAAEPVLPTVADESNERSRLRGAVEWLVVLGSAVIVALLLRAFLFQAFFIPSESMEVTLRVDDRVLVNKLSYQFGGVERGEVVVFRRPEGQPGEFRDLIKRVIGLPGESIEARDNTIFINGQLLIEPYLMPGEVIGDFGPLVIPDGEYFMMGDNRDNSGDSRVFGTVDGERIIGRAFFLFWPLDRIGSL